MVATAAPRVIAPYAGIATRGIALAADAALANAVVLLAAGLVALVSSLVGLALAIIPLFAGFLPVLVDPRRRGLPDFLAGTVVVHVPDAA
jgi:hypothetical protein